jgi:8-oxo-dGTP pyrophosphatase MutT (NUDIX family)
VIVKPAPAAGLVLLRQISPESSTGALEVLLGRRNRRSRFMPDVYVFPGGRVDAEDGQPSGFAENLRTAPEPSSLDERALAAHARTALRETFEETGLLVAQAGVPATADGAQTRGVWAAYAQAGLAPAFAAISLTARAITPAEYPIRFDTYFFTADGAIAHGNVAGDGELVDIGWVPVDSAPALPMAEITRLILQEALIRHGNPTESRDLATFSV